MMQKQSLVLGERLRSIRKMRGYTQNELAAGICTQGVISNIEGKNGKENPSSSILFQLSERLGVSMSYLYGQDDNGELITNKDIRDTEVSEIIKNLKQRRDYSALRYIIESEKNKNLHLTNAEKQFLLWHEAICTYYDTSNSTLTKEIFQKALKLDVENNDKNNLQLIEINLSLGIIEYEENNYNESKEILLKCIEAIMNNKTIKAPEILAKIYYNLSNVCSSMKEFDQSLQYSFDAIETCVQNNILSVIGDSLYQIGYCYHLKGKENLSINYMEKALVIFTIQKNDLMVKNIQKSINSVDT
ncbi:helix-turn-helix domain-containing protein [Shouchella sp. JSM 1781072]|uniref:helix-turn-helix domain-containing protein n=1 Tax=Shouchella sp. JSM 1781072 TaxID=3344581 RepID=UPI0035BFDF8A